MIKKINFKKHVHLIVTFPFLLLLSLNVYKDYGISIDEESTRINGLVSLNYICEFFFPEREFNFQLVNNIPDLNTYPFREYGVLFEIILILIVEVFLGVKEFSEIFYLRHLLTNFLFLVSLIFFYFISTKIFNNKYFPFLSLIILCTSPRIFAESFYNDKDIVFLSFFIFTIFFSIKFLKNINYQNAFMLSLFSAFLINIRVIGIYMVILIVFFLIIKISMKNNFIFKKINILIFFLFFNFVFLFIFWPFLWEAPIENFLYAIKSFSKYPWGGQVFYLGNFYKAEHLPWHYSSVYFFATTSLFLILTIVSGLWLITSRFIKRLFAINENQIYKDIWRGDKENILLFIFFTFVTPLLLIFLFNSIIYNGWRHLYFLFPSLVLMGVYFIDVMVLINSKKKFAIIFPIILSVVCINNLYNLIKLHPYQYVYFNVLFEKNANKLFEIDYWGVSNKNSLEIIAKKYFKKDKLIIGVASFTDLYLSKKMLSQDLQKKIIISGQDYTNADLIFTNNYFEINPKYDDKYDIPKNFKKYFSLKKGSILINEYYINNDKIN